MRKCSTCNNLLPDSEFWKRSKGKDRKHWRCKSCTRKYRFELRRKTKKKIIRYLGGCCSKCGHISKSGASLSVDHRDPKNKNPLSTNMYQWSWNRVIEELEKGDCWLLCMNCHMELEFERGTYGR